MNSDEAAAERNALQKKLKERELEVSQLREKAGQSVSREEFDQIVGERTLMTAKMKESESLLQKLRDELSILRLEHENLRTSAELARLEIERLRAAVRQAGPEPTIAGAPEERELAPREETPAPLPPLRPIAVPRGTAHASSAHPNGEESRSASDSSLGDAAKLHPRRA